MLPTKEQLEGKVWYRLFRVFIYVSTALVAIIFFIWSASQGAFNNWRTSRYIYSFEKDYSLKSGQEEDCSFSLSEELHPPPANGGFDAYKYVRDLGPARAKISCGDLSVSNFVGHYCGYAEHPLFCDSSHNYSVDNIILAGLKDGSFNNIKSKYITETDWDTITKVLGVFIAIPLGWFLILKFAVYPAVLYTIYGKRK